MSKPLDISVTSRRTWLSVGLPIVTLVLIVAMGALTVFVNFAHQQNQEFRAESRRLVSGAVTCR